MRARLEGNPVNQRKVARIRPTILLIDADDGLRERIEGALERLDYRVLGAATGREAVQCLSAYGPADLTVLDITLPDVDGVRLAFRILARHYTRRVLFVSDHCDDVVFLHPTLSRRVSFGGRRTPKVMLAAIQQVVPHRGATTVRVRAAGQVEHLTVQDRAAEPAGEAKLKREPRTPVRTPAA